MTTESPRTNPAEVMFDGEITRFAGQLDDSRDPDADLPPCPACGSTIRDGWMDEGAVTFRLKCVECKTVFDRDGEMEWGGT